jgi:hypothetical protein
MNIKEKEKAVFMDLQFHHHPMILLRKKYKSENMVN